MPYSPKRVCVFHATNKENTWVWVGTAAEKVGAEEDEGFVVAVSPDLRRVLHDLSEREGIDILDVLQDIIEEGAVRKHFEGMV